MTNCCSEKPKAPVEQRVAACAACGGIGRSVSTLTLKHMVKPQFLTMVTKPGFRFCASPDCDVVYYHADGEQLRKTDLRVRVGIKEAEEPAPLCYCFGFTRAMLLEELRSNGCPTIPERIAAELRAGNCACELRNPHGSCCLGSITAEIKKWTNAQARRAAASNIA